VWGFANKRKAPLRTGGEKERAVVIFLKTVAQLYFASGENITVFLPFVTQAAWPLPSGGVIIQREISWSERHAAARGKGPRPSAIDRANMSVLEEMNTVPDPLPILYTLTERFGEIKPVMEGSLTGGVRDLHPTIVPGTLAAQFSATQSILYVSPDPYPLIVTYDRRDNRIIVFRHVYIRLPKDEDDEDDKPERTQLAHKRLLDTDDLRRHAGLTSSRRERERERERGVAPPAPSDPLERVRRKSRLSTASFLPPEDDFDAGQFALEGVSTAMGGARSRLSVGAADRVADRMGDRRASVAGNLSVAGGGRPSSGLSAQAEKRMSGWEFPKAALGILAEDLRDTTMMHGLVKERKRSEVVIERVFDWRCPG
jgi:anaphase-promoting complex subunit 1